jgi:Mlc titration factor MtfA (ptsG expression regulator)
VIFFLKSRRRKKLLAQPLPESWRAILQRNVHHAALLDAAQRSKLHDLIKVMVAEKSWEGCDGFEMTDEVRVTISALAGILVLGFEPNYYFDRVRTILVFPDMLPPRRVGRLDIEPGVLVDESDDDQLLGDLWHRGPIRLSWTHVLEAGQRRGGGVNVVFHEFAHYLDELEGECDGMPPLAGQQARQTWRQVMDREYQRLVRDTRRGRATLLDQYGAENQAEFFAVATECFFEQPHALQRRHPELYDLLRNFYRQDPTQWRGA